MSLKINISAVDCGKAFAHADNEQQSEIINALGEELWIACKGSQGFEQQCCYLSDRLNKNGTDLIKELAAFIELREERKEK